MDDQTDFHRLAQQLSANARDLEADLEWLAQMLEWRMRTYFDNTSPGAALRDAGLPPPDIKSHDVSNRSPYANFIIENRLGVEERLIVLLALAPTLRPQLLDVLWMRNQAIERGFSEFGGVPNASIGAFLPTGETACFLLAGDSIAARLNSARLFERDQRLAQSEAVQLAATAFGESPLAGALQVSRRFLSLIMRGEEVAPEFDQNFPARRVRTGMSWQDLVLPSETLQQLEEVQAWVQHGHTLLQDWGMAHKLRPGYTALFCGPPGTGKTLSACLLGKLCQRDVYKIDLSMVVSKYIGETEKNLGRVFDQAEHRGWILFFDEADALFGKRTRVDDAHDRYANQEVSFLLQRIEEFDGVVILASNLKSNIDDAFLRRFQAVVNFAMPRAAERLRIWADAFSPKAVLDEDVALARIAERHELSGGTIMNVARYASLKALARGESRILAEDLEEGIRRELLKEGRAF